MKTLSLLALCLLATPGASRKIGPPYELWAGMNRVNPNQSVAPSPPCRASKEADPKGPQDDFAGSVPASDPALKPGRLKSSAGPTGRDPQQATRFVRQFNQELALPAEVLAKREHIMVSGPSKFLRINPALFYVDVKGPYSAKAQLLSRPAPQITIAGDCHLGNLGTVRGPSGKTIWGINDFDVAGKGSPEWDLERMASSVMLMARDAKISDSDAQSIVKHLAKSYLEEIAKLADSKPCDVAGVHKHEAWGPVKKLIDHKSDTTQKHMLAKFTTPDQSRLLRNEELHEASAEEQKVGADFLAQYEKTQGPTPEIKRPVRLLDMARRLDSGGSTYGLHRFYALVEGQDGTPRILEIKQELPSAPEQSTGDLTRANAQHIFQGMQALGGTLDPTMTTTTLNGSAYFVRERQREKGAIDPVQDLKSVEDWKALADQAGMAIARVHGHQSQAAASINQWVGDDRDTLIQNLQAFASAYAEQTRQDCQAYAASLSSSGAKSSQAGS